MIYIGSNLLAILAATVLGLLIGAIYQTMPGGPAKKLGPGRSSGMIVVAFIAEFWLASILAGALIIAPVQAGAWTVAIGTAVIIWIGFVLPVLVASYRARHLSAAVMFGDCAHWLIVMLSQAAVLHLIGLVRPT